MWNYCTGFLSIWCGRGEWWERGEWEGCAERKSLWQQISWHVGERGAELADTEQKGQWSWVRIVPVSLISSGDSSAFRLVKLNWSFQLSTSSWFTMSILSAFVSLLLHFIAENQQQWVEGLFCFDCSHSSSRKIQPIKVRRQQKKKYCWLWN